jgi:hypothetical protein
LSLQKYKESSKKPNLLDFFCWFSISMDIICNYAEKGVPLQQNKSSYGRATDRQAA